MCVRVFGDSLSFLYLPTHRQISERRAFLREVQHLEEEKKWWKSDWKGEGGLVCARYSSRHY
jgi:hypothetical protein